LNDMRTPSLGGLRAAHPYYFKEAGTHKHKMEWTIPIQTFETSKVRLGQLSRSHKPLVPLAYVDGELHFNTLSLLLPLQQVKSYDPVSGRLVLSLTNSSSTLTKLQSLQDTLLGAVRNQQGSWFPGERIKSAEEIRDGYQPMIEHANMHLYCPMYTGQHPHQNEIQIYSKGMWTKGRFHPSLFSSGAPVRIAIRIQGISFHQHPISGMWTGKFRLQHRILAILSPVVGAPPPLPAAPEEAL